MSAGSYFRFPHIRKDLITFVAEDDLWIGQAEGGRAYRLTADRVPVKSPRISPDGTKVAWTASRNGAHEVYVQDVDGGVATRLTYWGQDRTLVRGWISNTAILVVSSTGEAQTPGMFAHSIPVDGSPATRLPYGWTHDLVLGPAKGALLSTTTTVEPAWWKRYRGGTAAQLWLDTAGNGKFSRIHEDLPSSLVSPLWTINGAQQRIGFVSDHEGSGQIYSSAVIRGKVSTSELIRHTNHDFYARHASTDGTQVVYVSGGELWMLPNLDQDSEPRQIDIDLAGPRTATQPLVLDLGSALNNFEPDKDGRASVIGARGSVQWLSHRDGPARVLAEGAGVRRRTPVVLGDRGQVVWVTDADGDDALEIMDVKTPSAVPRILVRSGKLGRVTELVASPDGKRLAVATHDGRLMIIDGPATGNRAVRPKELDRTTDGDVSDLAFSPDSAWLAWSHPAGKTLAQIKIAELGSRSIATRVHEVTPARFNDFSPSFTADGKHLAFLSYRSFDPIYDSYVFDLSFPGGCRPYLIPLQAITPSPFAARVGGRSLEADHDEIDDSESTVAAPRETTHTKDAKDQAKVSPTVIDLDGLDQRIVAFPIEAGRNAALHAVQGGAVWLNFPLKGELGDDLADGGTSGRPVLRHIDLATGKVQDLIDDLDAFAVTGDGARIVVHSEHSLKIVPSNRKVESDSPDSVEVDLTQSHVEIVPRAQWQQMYAETWRLMRDNFWRPDMGGIDWESIHEKYRPLVDRVGSHDELVDVLWEMQGELGSSHAYVMPAPSAGDPVRKQGLLGADLVFIDGKWIIERIVPGESSMRAARSPLVSAGVGAKDGDSIVAISGRLTARSVSPQSLLLGTAGKPVEITLQSPGRGARPRRAVITPIADEMPLRYQDWVSGRRRHVHELTDGRVGYLHVPDMMSAGWAQLHRDLRTEIGREGVIVDIRGNRGGHTSQLIVEKLARSVIGWDMGRGYQPESYPGDARRGPLVAVTDMHAGSDGDIVTAAIKSLGLGPVIGTRTWGGVVGIDGRYALVDGTAVTQPRYAFWFEKFGWGVENYGVDPDIEVPVTPQDRVAGHDVQLDYAVDLILRDLKGAPAKNPPVLPST
ncbi:MAG: S41 family peptidase [Antricoccus sp.]